MLFTGKLNRMRNYAMLTCFFGIGVMYVGYAGFAGFLGSFFQSYIFMSIFLGAGLLNLLWEVVYSICILECCHLKHSKLSVRNVKELPN